MLFAWNAPAMAEENFPPPRHQKGIIGGPDGEEWRLGQFTGLILNGITYALPAADGTATYHLQTDGAGTLSWGASGTPTMDTVGDPAADVTLVYADNFTDLRTFADTNEDMFILRGIGAFGDVSVVRIDTLTGNPTDGTVLEVYSHDPNVDPLVVSASTTARALVVGQNTGVVTIAGVAEGTSALVVALGDILVTDGDLHLDAGDALFDEDVTITGDLIGGTGLINYTNFDVDAAGNVTSLGNLVAVDGTFSGNVSVTGTFLQDALAPASASPQDITLDGGGTGGVTVGGTSTGTITLGANAAGATLVSLPATVDLTMAGGQLNITDTASGDVVTITNNTMTTNSAITIVANAVSTGKVISVTADGITSGDLLYLDTTAAGQTTGNFINAFDGAATVFEVGDNGVTTIAGGAAADALIVTAGDIQITAGDIDLDLGNIAIDNTADEGNTIKRNNATGTAAVLEIEETHATGGINLLLDTKNTTAAEYNLDMTSAGATQIHLTASGAAADGILIDVTDSYTGQGIVADLGSWLGTTGEGYISIVSDSGAVNEVGQAIRVNLQGTGTAGTAVEGKAFHAESQAAIKAGESLVYLDTLTNTALHIDNEGTAADGIKFDVAASYTGQGIVADLGTWLGTAGEGFISLTSDNAATIPAGQFVRMRQLGTGQHAGAIGGSLLFMEDDAVAPAAGTSYLAYIDATNIEALHVDTGKVLVDETVTATGGISAGNAADSFLHTATVEISNAEIKLLRANKKTLIAAPGAANFIEVVSAVLILDYGTNVLTESADNLVIEYATSGADITAAIEATGFIDQAVDQMALVLPAGIATDAASDLLNNAVQLFNTGDGEYAGNVGADTTMTVKITYRIHAAGL